MIARHVVENVADGFHRIAEFRFISQSQEEHLRMLRTST